MVGSTSWTDGAHSTQTVCGGGSSMALSSTLVVRSAMRSASSMTMTRQRPPEGDRDAVMIRSRTSSIAMTTFSVASSVTSGWVPAIVVVHAWHTPHPPCGHCSAAAKARAATDRPEPGGPVTSHACVMAAGLATAACSAATADSCPTTSSHTVTSGPRDGGP